MQYFYVCKVFLPNHPTPIGTLDRSQARILCAEGHAVWKNRCDDIRLTRSSYPLRGLSCFNPFPANQVLIAR